jgi:hypothetical protein
MDQPSDAHVPYPLIADIWRGGKVIPFLGAAASFVGAPWDGRLPDGRTLANTLVEWNSYPGEVSDPLTKIAQYVEDSSAGRAWLLNKVAEWFDTDFDDPASKLAKPYQCAVTAFIEAVVDRLPPLIVTTNYDTIIERTLERLRASKPDLRYVVLSHIMPRKTSTTKLLVHTSLAAGTTPEALIPTKIQQRFKNGDYDGHTIIYKMHGTSRFSATGKIGSADSIVLTEGDYINFLAADLLGGVPVAIMQMLQAGQFLFLGYALEDWNFRVLLQRLQSLQAMEQIHWACRLLDETKPDGRIERAFWKKRNVELYNMDLVVFLRELAVAINKAR